MALPQDAAANSDEQAPQERRAEDDVDCDPKDDSRPVHLKLRCDRNLDLRASRRCQEAKPKSQGDFVPGDRKGKRRWFESKNPSFRAAARSLDGGQSPSPTHRLSWASSARNAKVNPDASRPMGGPSHE